MGTNIQVHCNVEGMEGGPCLVTFFSWWSVNIAGEVGGMGKVRELQESKETGRGRLKQLPSSREEPAEVGYDTFVVEP